MHFIGIDPGKAGGLACIRADRSIVCVAYWPDTEHELLSMLVELGAPTPSAAILERVSASPQMGVTSAFKFGMNVGVWRCALTACRIPFEEVPPSKWMAVMGVQDPNARGRLGAKRKKRDKNISKRKAQALFPEVDVTHATADALLLAEYCRRLHVSAVHPTKPVQQEMPYGENERDTEEDRRLEQRETDTRTEAFIEDVVAFVRRGQRAAQAAAKVAAGNGKPGHR